MKSMYYMMTGLLFCISLHAHQTAQPTSFHKSTCVQTNAETKAAQDFAQAVAQEVRKQLDKKLKAAQDSSKEFDAEAIAENEEDYEELDRAVQAFVLRGIINGAHVRSNLAGNINYVSAQTAAQKTSSPAAHGANHSRLALSTQKASEDSKANVQPGAQRAGKSSRVEFTCERQYRKALINLLHGFSSCYLYD